MSPQTELTLLGGVAVIRLSRPPLNILTWDFRTEITERIKQCANENHVRVIVVGSTERLELLVGRAKAKELMYTGASIDAPEAFRIGLVNRVVPAGRALDEAIKLAKVIAQHSPLALRSIKELVDAVHHAPDEMH